jgi:hypothetical protein
MPKIVSLFAVVLAMWTAAVCAQGKEGGKPGPRPGEPEKVPSEEVILRWLERDSRYDQQRGDPDELVGMIDGLYQDLILAGKYGAELNSTRVVEAILAFPAQDSSVLCAKISALGHFKTISPGAHTFILDCLDATSERVQRAAAEALVQWGQDLDQALPVLIALGDYLPLQNLDDSRIEAILREGARSCPRWEGRMHAAFALESYGDSTTVLDVAREVLAQAPIDVDDNSVARAKHQALTVIAKTGTSVPIAEIARLADDRNLLVRVTSVDLLERLATRGSPEARQALRFVADNNADAELRATAAAAIRRIDRAAGRER